jgi:hypothetical protein
MMATAKKNVSFRRKLDFGNSEKNAFLSRVSKL